jgi:hypothetical protein
VSGSGTTIGETFDEAVGDSSRAARRDVLGSGTNIGGAFDETVGNSMGISGGDASGSSTKAFNEMASNLMGAAGGDALGSGTNIVEAFIETTGKELQGDNANNHCRKAHRTLRASFQLLYPTQNSSILDSQIQMQLNPTAMTWIHQRRHQQHRTTSMMRQSNMILVLMQTLIPMIQMMILIPSLIPNRLMKSSMQSTLLSTTSLSKHHRNPIPHRPPKPTYLTAAST